MICGATSSLEAADIAVGTLVVGPLTGDAFRFGSSTANKPATCSVAKEIVNVVVMGKLPSIVELGDSWPGGSVWVIPE